MHFVDTNTVMLNNQNYPYNVFVCTGKTTLTTNFLDLFYKALNLCSTDQLTVEVIRNCNMSFFAENWYLQELYFDILWNTYSLDVICLLPHEVVVYDIKFFATSYFFNK